MMHSDLTSAGDKMTRNPQHRSDSRRATQRTSCNFVARISFDSVYLCNGIIKDISVGGVRLLIPRQDWVPSEFEIESEVFEGPVKVRKAWANKEHVGARFMAS